MSSPRAARSVATSTRSSPPLKSASVRVRCDWLLLPWIASALMSSRLSCSARRLAPCLVRVNTRTCFQPPVLIRCARSSRLRPASTGCTTWLTSSEGALRRATSTTAGSLRKECASSRISCVNVAENSRFCRCFGSSARDAPDVADEAHVEHAVRLVQHQDLDAAQVHCLLLHVVEQPTRRGNQNLDPALERSHLRLYSDAAVDYRGRRGQVRTVGAHALLHLRSELAGGGEDQHARRAAPVG